MYVTFQNDPGQLTSQQAASRGELLWPVMSRAEGPLSGAPSKCFACGLGAENLTDAVDADVADAIEAAVDASGGVQLTEDDPAPPEAPTAPPVVSKHDAGYKVGMIIAGVTALVTIGLFALTLTLKAPR